MKCQSGRADNLSDNNMTSKPSGVYNVTSYDPNNATDVFTKDGLMHDPSKLNLQKKNDTSLLPEGVDYQAMAKSVRIGQDDISTDSINTICSEQFKLQGSTQDSEGSHINNIKEQEHWAATESTLHCEAVHVIMICTRCSRTVDCQWCPTCQGPISTVYLPCY